MGKLILTIAIIIIFGIGILLSLDFLADKQGQSPSPSVTATPTPTNEPNISVSKPQPGDTVGLPLVIEGEARVFEATFAYRIKDGDGSLLLERHAMTDAGTGDIGEFRPFKVTINYSVPKFDSGSVEVFEYSAKDGTEINKVVVAIKFADVQSQTVKAYFSNEKKDPNMLNCSNVYAISRRIPKTTTPARAALEELLIGVDSKEYEDGYRTSINQGVKINSLVLEGGVITADFDDTLEAGVGGSCRAQATVALITQPLKQFSSVKKVVISINGRTEDILQP